MDFFIQNLVLEKDSQVRNLRPNFTFVGLKILAYSPRNCQNWYFWYKICPKWYTL